MYCRCDLLEGLEGLGGGGRMKGPAYQPYQRISYPSCQLSASLPACQQKEPVCKQYPKEPPSPFLARLGPFPSVGVQDSRGIKGRAQGDRRETVKIWIWICRSDHYQAGIRTKESLLVPFPPSIFLVWACSLTSKYLTFCSRTFA